MAAAPIRTRPLVAVVSGVPLFVEAMVAAFAGIADVQPVSADDIEAHALVRAFRPDAVIVEGVDVDAASFNAPCLLIDLKTRRITKHDDAGWRELDIELSPEAIRNTVVAELYGGDAE